MKHFDYRFDKKRTCREVVLHAPEAHAYLYIRLRLQPCEYVIIFKKLSKTFVIIEQEMSVQLKETLGVCPNGKTSLKYTLIFNEEQYVAIKIGESMPIIYDKKFEDDICKYSWHLSVSGYAKATIDYMHRYIAIDLAKIPGCNDMSKSVDHINEIKTDNRLCNLRMASQSEQNHNRKIRNDKKPPPPELIACGITELPKFVRWDTTEKKFVIDKHPRLVQDVLLGKRTKPCLSGTKSRSYTVEQKYQDILAKFMELGETESENVFKAMKVELQKGYRVLCDIIECYENGVTYTGEIAGNEIETEQFIKPERKVSKGRKKKSLLAKDCGITDEMLPKYCRYVPVSDKRGDKFIIERHPGLEAQPKICMRLRRMKDNLSICVFVIE